MNQHTSTSGGAVDVKSMGYKLKTCLQPMDNDLTWMVLLVFIVYSISGFSFIAANSRGTLQADKNISCTSQNITFNCTVTDSHYLSRDLVFDVNNMDINDKDVNFVSNTSAVFSIINLTKEKTLTKVKCCIKTCKNSSNIVKYQYLQLIDYPIPVRNFTCIVMDYVQNMICSWTNPTEYSTVTLQWKIHTYNRSWLNCPSGNNTSCFWNSTEVGDFSMKHLEFNVTVSSRCGISVSSRYNINTMDIVKPSPVTSLNTEVLNSSCIRLTWNSLYTDTLFGSHYDLSVRSIWNDNKVIKLSSPMRSYKQCGLIPYTNYTFEIRVHPNTSEGYWSDSTRIVAKTYSDVPNASPEMTEGCYSWTPRQCASASDGSDTQRKVTFYWKPMNYIDTNGVITAIHLQINTKEYNLSMDATQFSLQLQCNVDYVVSVTASNINGTSKVKSTVHIPSSLNGPRQPDFVVEMSNSSFGQQNMVHVQWKGSTTNLTLGYAVIWCPLSQGQCSNQSAINWVILDGNNNTTIVNIPSPEMYVYGVSMVTKEGSSGLSWQSCIYTAGVAPKEYPSNLHVTGQINNSISVSWNGVTCLSGEPIIIQYLLHYCLAKDDSKCDKEYPSIPIPAKQTSYMLTYLDPNSQYAVRIQSLSKQRRLGPLSDPVIGSPVDPTPSLKVGAIVGIVIGSVLVAIGIVAVVKCVLVKTKKKFALPSIKDVPIHFIKEKQSYPSVKTDVSKEESEDMTACIPDGYVTCTEDLNHLQSTSTNDMIAGIPDGYVTCTEVLNHLQSTSTNYMIAGNPDGYVTGIEDLNHLQSTSNNIEQKQPDAASWNTSINKDSPDNVIGTLPYDYVKFTDNKTNMTGIAPVCYIQRNDSITQLPSTTADVYLQSNDIITKRTGTMPDGNVQRTDSITQTWDTIPEDYVQSTDMITKLTNDKTDGYVQRTESIILSPVTISDDHVHRTDSTSQQADIITDGYVKNTDNITKLKDTMPDGYVKRTENITQLPDQYDQRTDDITETLTDGYVQRTDNISQIPDSISELPCKLPDVYVEGTNIIQQLPDTKADDNIQRTESITQSLGTILDVNVQRSAIPNESTIQQSSKMPHDSITNVYKIQDDGYLQSTDIKIIPQQTHK